MDKKRLIKNVLTGIITNIVILLLNLFARRELVKIIGEESLGLVALFTSVSNVVTLVSLGMSGVAPICMYRAIINKDDKKLNAVYCFFSKAYIFVFIAFTVVSLLLTPLIPYLSKNYSNSFNIYLLYIIYVVSISISFFYVVRVSLINAYKNNYVGNIIHFISVIVKHFFQILFLYLTKSFYVYMSAFAISEILSFVLYYLYTNKNHKDIISKKEKLDDETKKEIKQLIKGSTLITIGSTFVYSLEGVLISSFIGVDILAKFSNYNLILSALILVFKNFYTQLGSIIGYAYYENDKNTVKKYFNFFYLFTYFIASFIFFCYFKCINSFINLFFENGLVETNIIIFLTISRFVEFMLLSERLFKDNIGLFKYDSWKCIPEAIINVSLSILLINYIGIIGIFIARAVTDLFISGIVEPYVAYKHMFNEKPTKYYLANYSLTAIFIGLLYGLNYSLEITIENQFANFIVSGFYACIFALPSFILLFVYIQKNFGIKHFIKSLFSFNK